MGSLDLPSEPDEPGRPGRARDGSSRVTSRARELPDPDERGRVYEAMRAHASAETGPRVEADLQADVTGRQCYRDGVPGFREMWVGHERRWPDRPRIAAARSADPPERRAATAEAVGRVREAEPGLSKDAQAIGRENEHNGWLEGFGHRLKSEDRLKEKIAEGLEIEPSKTPAEALRQVADAIRYTFCFQPENYTRGYYDIKERLEGRGHEMFYSRNYWADPEYKGINTRWVTREGQRFEMQFHTPDSFHAKHHVTHAAYERIRDPATSKRELRELHAFQRMVSARIEVPDGATDIPDYKKEGF